MYPNRACQGLVGLPGGLLTGSLAFAHTPGHAKFERHMNSKVAKVTKTVCELATCSNV